MIHAYHWKHHLPSDQPDQIQPVVNQIRTVRKWKAGLNSTECKIIEQYGSFGGLDTCNYVEFSHSGKRSILISENECKGIANRYDVNPHLDVLCKHKVISSETDNSMRNKAQKSNYKNVNDNYSKGTTYSPFKYPIGFQG